MKWFIRFSFVFTFAVPLWAESFSFEDVVKQAEEVSLHDYIPQNIQESSPLLTLTYDEYRNIRYKESYRIGQGESNFQLDLFPCGPLFKKSVTIHLLEEGQVVHLQGRPEVFANDSGVPLSDDDLSFLSGFRVRNPINHPGIWDEFLVFQGASYFRGIPEKALYGLSARGVVLSATPTKQEEFPDFQEFWIEMPSSEGEPLRIYALLNGPSLTGAFQFDVFPGEITKMQVKVVLFSRTDIFSLGIAPLTSMFLFDESDRSRIEDFRNEVHDSDGLKILSTTGEEIWRPLINPHTLQVSSFSPQLKGFGLLQRSRDISDYQDFEAGYERRPNAWVEPGENWPKGSLDLLEIPNINEAGDNIVAFWKVDEDIPLGQSLSYSYNLFWTLEEEKSSPMKVLSTKSGPAMFSTGKDRLFVIDFSPSSYSLEDLTLDIQTSQGSVRNETLQYNPITGGVRASFVLTPEQEEDSELRLIILDNEMPVSETWLYRSSYEK
jgi:periplasmic glucans biosynthesis protein